MDADELANAVEAEVEASLLATLEGMDYSHSDCTTKLTAAQAELASIAALYDSSIGSRSAGSEKAAFMDSEMASDNCPQGQHAVAINLHMDTLDHGSEYVCMSAEAMGIERAQVDAMYANIADVKSAMMDAAHDAALMDEVSCAGADIMAAARTGMLDCLADKKMCDTFAPTAAPTPWQYVAPTAFDHVAARNHIAAPK